MCGLQQHASLLTPAIASPGGNVLVALQAQLTGYPLAAAAAAAAATLQAAAVLAS